MAVNHEDFGIWISLFHSSFQAEGSNKITRHFRHVGELPQGGAKKDYPLQLIKKYSYLLSPNLFINGKNNRIKQVINGLKLNQTTKTPLSTIIRSIYDYSLSKLTYGKPIDGLYSYNQALTDKTTDCGGFSTLMASLLQSINIPSRLVVGFVIRPSFLKLLLVQMGIVKFNYRSLYMHTWLEVLLPDKTWFPLDASIEWQRNKGLISQEGGFGNIPADRLVVSYGQDFVIKINNKKYKIDLLQKPINLLSSRAKRGILRLSTLDSSP